MPSNYDPKDGDIIYGPFANDYSQHNAVLLHIVEGVVYLFPMIVMPINKLIGITIIAVL